MISFYIIATVLCIVIAYIGIDETLRLIRFADLWINYQIIKVRMRFMMRRLEKELNLPRRNIE